MLWLLAALTIQVGVSGNQPLHNDGIIDYRESASLHLQVGREDSGGYVWGSLAKGETNVLGQKISSVWQLGAGLGYEKALNEIFYTFVEAGIGYPHDRTNYAIQQEVAYTYLVGRHNVANRPVPVDVLYPYDQDSYASTWDIDYGLVLRAGVGFEPTQHTRVSLAYKYFNPKGVIEIYDPEARAAGRGWWQEYVTINMNVVEMTFSLRY